MPYSLSFRIFCQRQFEMHLLQCHLPHLHIGFLELYQLQYFLSKPGLKHYGWQWGLSLRLSHLFLPQHFLIALSMRPLCSTLPRVHLPHNMSLLPSRQLLLQYDLL